ncbi:unnamed protein product [Linum tenue]|uniref:F-box domain-containing protein n=1 Tax=Linum tenue TaxID=586396 RepID=A0AAV0RGW7_9ROSI|nr:unnamed protein product [Linum tenue]
MAHRDLRLLPCSSSSAGKLRRVSNPPPPPISKLVGDLLLEVLIRVPDPRSAFRCKLVCKRWNSLISQPYFNRRFVSHHQRMNQSLLIPSQDRESVILSFLPMPGYFAESSFHVIDCFKDLVLCGFWASPDTDPGIVRSWFVCNPFTKQWVALPLMPNRSMEERGGLIARLVCEPRSNPELDLGDDQVFVHSEYRFRVVCMYSAVGESTKLDVFCSESGAWTEGALVLDSDLIIYREEVVSCNGRLFCCAQDAGPRLDAAPILGVDAFHLDRPPFRVDGHPGFEWKHFHISASQGVLHVARLDKNLGALPLLTVWRQDEGGDGQHSSWSELYQVSLSKSCCFVACLHPDDPEIVFLENHVSAEILYRDVRTGEEGVFDSLSFRWRLFQPRISCWPTPIPNYGKLRGAYDGSYDCWVKQTSRQAAPAPALPLRI